MIFKLGHYQGMLVVDTPEDYQAWLKERAELSGTQTVPAPLDRPPGEPPVGPAPGSVPPPGAPRTANPSGEPSPSPSH